MARPLRIEYENAFYHIIKRGLEKREIYKTDKDKEWFLKYLEKSHNKYKSICHAYCLMDNHYHMIIQTPRANLTKVMHYVNASYAMYYNKKNNRAGPLYQGRYKSILIEADEYLYHLSRYIHLNPIRAKVINKLEEYKWSSYQKYIKNKTTGKGIETNFILSNFGRRANESKSEYKKFVLAGIGKEKEIRDYIEDNMHKGFVLGSAEFFKDICKKYIDGKKDEEIPLLRELQRERELGRKEIEDKIRIVVDDEKEVRKLTIYIMQKYTQKSLKEISSKYKGIGDTGISTLCKRLEMKRSVDKKTDKLIARIEKMCKVET